MASAFRFNLQKILNRDRKSWPVTVYKIEQRGNGLKFSNDRGRRIQNPETQEREYEFLREKDVTIPIERKYMQTGPGNHPLLLIQKISGEDKDYFIPIQPGVQTQIPDGIKIYQCLECSKIHETQPEDLECRECGEKVKELDTLPGATGLSLLVEHSQFIKVAKNELERHYEITKDERSAWYQDPQIQAAILFFGAGMFFFLAAMGYSKMITQPFIEIMENAPTALVPVALTTRVEKFCGRN